jgi:hypothetical protein
VSSRYILRITILLAVILYLLPVFPGPILLAPQPILHNIMRDGFFAQELLKKRPALLRAGGSYPAMIWGGTVEMPLLVKKDAQSLGFKPAISTTLINSVLCFDDYVMLALCFKSNKGVHFPQDEKKFALIFGDYSRSNLNTHWRSLRLPFKLYGAIGCFIPPDQPWRSDMIGALNDISLITGGENKVVPGLLIGAQRDFGIHACSVQIMPSWKRLRINPQWTFSQLDYMISIGAGFDSEDSTGSIYGTFKKSIFTVSGHQLFEQIQIKKGITTRKGKTHTITEKVVSPTKGHIEGSCCFSFPVLELPGTLIMGYGWSQRPFGSKGQNAVFGVLKITITKYAQLRVGFKIQHKLLKDKKGIPVTLNYLTTQLNFNF